jgi:hypothetical protein
VSTETSVVFVWVVEIYKVEISHELEDTFVLFVEDELVCKGTDIWKREMLLDTHLVMWNKSQRVVNIHEIVFVI